MCPNCQAPLRGDADFCTNCGTRVRPSAPAGPAEPTRPAPGQPQYQAGFPPGNQQGYPAGHQPGYPPGAPPAYPPPAQSPGVQPGSAIASYHFDVGRLAALDRTVAIASGLVVISMFLPWFGVLGYTISGISLHGYLVIALLIDVAMLGYLALRAGWESMPVKLPIAHAPLLLVGTGVQLLLVLIAFLQSDRLGHEFGAYLALLAAIVACGAIAIPAIRAMQDSQQAGSR